MQEAEWWIKGIILGAPGPYLAVIVNFVEPNKVFSYFMEITSFKVTRTRDLITLTKVP